MAKVTARAWFDNCGGFAPAHSLDTLRAGIAAGLLNEQDEDGLTALLLAVPDWLDGIEELLRAGANTELRHYRTGGTALLFAVQEGKKGEAAVRTLLATGANPDAANHFGVTPRGWHAAPFAHIPEQPVQMPEPWIQNTEHLADHYHPKFKIPKREERETLKPGVAVDLYVYGPEREGKQNTVKVRITASSGQRPNIRYTATVETPIGQTNLRVGTTEVEFGPENVATVYVPRKSKKRKNA